MFNWLRKLFRQEEVKPKGLVILRDMHKFSETEKDIIVAMFKEKKDKQQNIAECLNKQFGINKSLTSYRRVYSQYLKQKEGIDVSSS